MPNPLPTPVPPVMPAVIVTPSAPSTISNGPTGVSAPTPTRRRRGPLVAVLVALVVLLLGAGGASAYYFLVYQQTPEKVIARSALAMSKLKSTAFVAQLTATSTQTKPMEPCLTCEPVNLTETQVLVGTARIKGVTTFDEQPTTDLTVTADVSVDGQPMFGPFSAQTRVLNGVNYINVGKFTLPGLVGGMIEPYADLVFDRWIEINKDRIAQSLGIADALKELEDKQADKQAELQTKYGGRVDKAIIDTLPKFIEVTDTIGTETLDGTKVIHYAYKANPAALKDLSAQLKEILDSDLTGAVKNQIEELAPTFEQLENPHGEVWIGKSDSLIRKVIFDADTTDESGYKAHISLSLALSALNVPVTVEKPAISTPVEEVVTAIILKITEDQAQQASDDDADGLTLADETKYGTDPNNPDTDGDGHPDGEEVEAGFNPNGPGSLADYEPLAPIIIE